MTKKILYQEIYDCILADILSGVFPPGYKLESEKAIAERFGVSRITSRKALEMLAQNGYIRKQAGLGSFVQEAGGQPEPEPRPSAPVPVVPEQATGQPDKMLGLLLSGISEVYGNILLHKAYDYARKEGYELITSMTLDCVEAEKQAIRTMKRLGVKGLMISPVTSLNYNYELVSSIIGGFPVVCINTLLRGIDSCLVGIDNQAALGQIVDYLADKGHTQIGFYSSPPSSSMCLTEIYEYYIEAMLRRNFTNFYRYIFTEQQISPNYLFYHGREEDRKKIREYLTSNREMTAVITSDYRAAVLLREAAEEVGMRVPEDLSIICFFEQTRPSAPKFFHHISLDEEQMARESIGQVIYQIEHPGQGCRRINVGFRLVQGSSVLDLKSGRVAGL